ncbi:putative signal transducing protein [Vibrio salinus]|uniref:putative signal transducing protein n=1 Tax=Vibrio salinus TaxID=2899784 RepID=UPI001E57EF4D|nr:DUF2007 domain-containing protein [Vibrio salinus]MCE0496002.1 DUF2007 domain-containing protein [Vibrio salinus]
MKLIYTHENKVIVENTRNYLQKQGVDCELRNEFAGGAIGDLSPIQTWPELWVSDEYYDQAAELIAQLSDESGDDNWICPECGEENAPSFDFCWNCQCVSPHVSE